jgi:hypothetical protein
MSSLTPDSVSSAMARWVALSTHQLLTNASPVPCCVHEFEVRSTRCWREMDSNPRSRFTYSPFRTPSCRLRDGPVRQNGNHPFATGYRAFEARFRRRVYRATAWGLSAGALPTSPRMGRSPPIGLRDAAGDVVRARDDRRRHRGIPRSQIPLHGRHRPLINGPRGARRAVSILNPLTRPLAG